MRGNDEEIANRLQHLALNEELDVLDKEGHIRVRPNQRSLVENDLRSHDLSYEIKVKDIQKQLKVFYIIGLFNCLICNH